MAPPLKRCSFRPDLLPPGYALGGRLTGANRKDLQLEHSSVLIGESSVEQRILQLHAAAGGEGVQLRLHGNTMEEVKGFRAEMMLRQMLCAAATPLLCRTGSILWPIWCTNKPVFVRLSLVVPSGGCLNVTEKWPVLKAVIQMRLHVSSIEGVSWLK